MTRSTIALSALAIVAVAAVLAACGGGGNSSSGGTPAATYAVGGTVTGLAVAGLVLQNNGADDLTINASGSFAFSRSVPSGTAYAVTVRTQPTSAAQTQNCTVSNGSGSVSGANVTTVAITCIATVINGISVPPPPGSANDSTIAGIDSDNNGIRDDIDIFIASKYGRNTEAVRAARISARARQMILLVDLGIPGAARIALQESGDAGVCAGRVFDAAGLSSSQEFGELHYRTYNTEARLQKHASAGAASGQFERSVVGITCQ